ncbi:MocR-like pyridoxine biosynthesis transcription factor PdxR [Paenibacillus durus]|uniref:Transcriptional regulator n=1 Tax=Paenibacillus durus TaxID=44251 RepID=A0A089HJG7_PAEDU|nr:PLP-dependent aminotransferase family protein [Paenibacillus durus]AIQ10820.1 transcriptional regulator [Paenibacillus durus]
MLIFPSLNDPGNEPLYIQLYEFLKGEIMNGSLPGGARLPSIRSAAAQLHISATPIETSYQQLLAEGFITSRPKSGYYVRAMHTYDSAEPRRAAPVSYRVTARDDREYTYDFHQSKNDFTLFPHKIWRNLLQEQVGRGDILHYGDPQGEPALRDSISSYLRQFRGLRCTPEQIVIGGDQYTLSSLLALMLSERSDSLGFEDPGYHLVPSTFQRHGFRTVPLPLDKDGLNVEHLIGSGAQVLYVSPSHQFPCGMTMPIARRMQLLEWAMNSGGILIEDDYDGEFRYHGRPVPSMQGLAEHSPVVYMGSFAQSVSPALCLHYMVLPEALLPAYYRLKNELYLEHSASRLNQMALHDFMERGHFGRHLRRMRQLYERKHDAVIRSVKRHFGETASLSGRNAGFHLLLTVKSSGAEEELAAAAREANVRIAPMGYTWWNQPACTEPSFILGFGGILEERIDDGIKALKEAWLE